LPAHRGEDNWKKNVFRKFFNKW